MMKPKDGIEFRTCLDQIDTSELTRDHIIAALIGDLSERLEYPRDVLEALVGICMLAEGRGETSHFQFDLGW